MSYKYLGDRFDIHTGGIDHIPIHHENEIAQSKGFSGHDPVNYWMHCNFLLVNNEKMSKSLNNLYTLKQLNEKGYEPLVYKMFNFSSHYRNQINFTWEAMDAAKTALSRLREGYLKHSQGSDIIPNEEIENYKKQFLDAINDDLNMQVAMSVVWDVIRNPKKSKDFQKLLLKFDEVLGLDLENYKPEEISLPEEVLELINKRNEARKNKDWAESDRIRDLLISKGYSVKDSKEGTLVEKI
jgi:cysteinyl-tRNA synthetase